MKKVFLPAVILAAASASMPLSDFPRLEEAWNESGYIFPLVYHMPESEIPEGIDEMVIGGVGEAPDSLTLYLIGIGPEGPVVFAEGPYTGEFNFTKSNASWDPDEATISIYFQMPFCARYAGARYLWQDQTLIPVEWLSGDPSLESLERVDSLLNIGMLEEAGEELGMIFYPGAYFHPMEMCSRFITSAHEHALAKYQSGDTAGALEVFLQANEALFYVPVGNEWYLLFSDPEEYEGSDMARYMEMDDYVRIINDYGFLLQQNGRNGEAVEVLENVIGLDPGRMVAYLNLADALWDCGITGEAIYDYRIYSGMMEDSGLSESIPSRVTSRLEQ